MTNKKFDRIADIAKYRLSMKRKLRRLGFTVDNDETTERLEELIEFINKDVG